MTPLKVLHVVSSVGMYGKEQVVLELMRQHREMGVESILSDLRLPDQEPKEMELMAEQEDFSVQYFELKAGLDFRGARAIVDYAMKENISLIHTHDYKGSILLGFQRLWCKTPPLIRTLHGFTTTSKLSKMAVYEWFDRVSLRLHRSVIGVSADMVAKLKRPLKIIKNGISTSKKTPIEGQDEILKFCETGTILGTIARLSAEKNQLAMIDALDVLLKKGLDVKLLLVGDGEERASLEARIKELDLTDSVLLTGFVRNARQFLQCIDLYLQPSLTEGTPISILEAMEADIPLCMTEVGAMATLIHKGAGHLLPVDAKGIAASLITLLEDKEMQMSLIKQARIIFEQEYSGEVMARAYLEAYNSL